MLRSGFTTVDCTQFTVVSRKENDSVSYRNGVIVRVHIRASWRGRQGLEDTSIAYLAGSLVYCCARLE